MKLTQSALEKATVFSIQGRVDASSSSELESALVAFANRGEGHAILDMNEVDYVSSAGLRALLIGLKQMSANQQRLLLAALNPDVMDVLKLTGFDKLLSCNDTVPDALAELAV